MAIELRATILTEAGQAVGLGHLARCVALYDALEALGSSPRLVVAGEAPEHVVGARTVLLGEWRTPEGAKLAAVGSDVVVVDSYLAGLDTYVAATQVAGVAAYLDDTARLAYPAGFIVNGNPGAERLVFARREGTELLVGTRYQLLRSEFGPPPARQIAESISSVLVVSGGSDAVGMRETVGRWLSEFAPDTALDFVDAPRSAAAMCDAMLAADVAVSAAGQTLYELAATGTPALAICVADNQVSQAEAFAEAGAIRLVGRWGEHGLRDRMSESLASVASAAERRALSEAGRRLVDGAGAGRVARTLVSAALGARIRVAAATPADEADLLALANDTAVRAASFSEHAIDAAEHSAWLARTLADSHVLLLVARDGSQLAGQVRFEIAEIRAVVSFSLAKPYRGYKLAAHVLARAEGMLVEGHPEVRTLVARVKAENRVSRQLFEGAGYAAAADSTGASAGAIEYRKSVSAGSDEPVREP